MHNQAYLLVLFNNCAFKLMIAVGMIKRSRMVTHCVGKLGDWFRQTAYKSNSKNCSTIMLEIVFNIYTLGKLKYLRLSYKEELYLKQKDKTYLKLLSQLVHKHFRPSAFLLPGSNAYKVVHS